MQLAESTKKLQEYILAHKDVSSISVDQIHKIYLELIDCLVDHNHLYYTENKPIISDKEYDNLFDYLKKIENNHPEIISWNSPTQWLVGQVSEWFQTAQHTTRLLSLENTYNAQDLRDWDERVRKNLEKSESKTEELTYTLEPKFDGLSVELIYKKWIFHQAITRWDWLVGDDITSNVKTIKNIPNKLKQPIDLAVRWEIMMPKSVRKELNKEREEDWEIPFANTRNAAAWSIKLLDSWEVARRWLVCFVYDILQYDTQEYDEKTKTTKIFMYDKKISWEKNTHEKNNILLENWLPVFQREKKGETIDEIIQICEDPKTKEYFETQDCDFDWLVIKVESIRQRDIIWSTDHHPRRAVAYKFPAQLASTQIISVDFQVWRTWIITPVANLAPVELSWVTIKRVSLHNFDFIKSKDLHIWDYVRIQRSWEVIPYIVSVITDRRTGEEKIIHPPKKCPSCEGEISHADIYYYCTNPHCPDKIKQEIEHFASKQGLDIQGIGQSSIDLLVDQKIIKTVADIYSLGDTTIKMQLLKFPWFGDKKVSEIISQIEESKHKPLRRLLNGLWIPHVGKKMAQDLATKLAEHGTTNWMIQTLTSMEFLDAVYGIGEKTTQSIIEFFAKEHNQNMIQRLINYWVNFDPKKYTDTSSNAGEKWTFSITGTFDLPREEIVQLFEKQGYKFHEQPIKTTDFMLIGEKAWSKKAKAQESWITIHEGRENIKNQFPFLKNIQSEKKSSPKINQSSLF